MASVVATPLAKPFQAAEGHHSGGGQLLRVDSLSSGSMTGSVFSVDQGLQSPDALSMDMASSIDSGDFACQFSGHSMSAIFQQVEQPPLDIALRIHNSQGKAQILQFSFDLQHDSYDSVAREMVSDLELPDSETPCIAAKIQACVKKEHVKRLQQQQQQALLVMQSHRATISGDVDFLDVRKPVLRRSISTAGVPDNSDPVSSQHHALAAKHSKRMASLLASCQRRASKSSADEGDNDVAHRRRSLDCEARCRTKVNYCVLRGMYVPDTVKKMSHRPGCATVLETHG